MSLKEKEEVVKEKNKPVISFSVNTADGKQLKKIADLAEILKKKKNY